MEISIIVPVYNVADYLDECLQSIANQTFRDYEVILVDDGSTDCSGDICQRWADLDQRFRYYRKKNEGLSPARNYGIAKARGKYLSFIDSDDWVNECFLEFLYQAIILENADIAECDVCRVNNRTGEKTVRFSYGNMGVEYSKRERIVRGNTAIWKCLIRASLWKQHRIEFPNCHGQARGVYALLVALANKVACVRKPLYYYRKFREGSLSLSPRPNGFDENAEGIQAYRELIKGFKRCGIFEEYKNTLERMLYYKASEGLAGPFLLKNEHDFLVLRDNFRSFLHEMMPTKRGISYATLGGYNLNRIAWDMNQIHDPYLRFNFSSIISIMHPVEHLELSHKNKYRNIMLHRDIHSDFWRIIEKEKPSYILIDLLEERFDIIETGGGYITKSDAFDSAGAEIEGRTIYRGSNECRELWILSCKAFLARLSKTIPRTHIILVKNYLSTKKGDLKNTVPFDNIQEITEVNQELERYYQILTSTCHEMKCIDVAAMPHYFTDKEYEYGAIPSHLNEMVNREIAELIEKKFEE